MPLRKRNQDGLWRHMAKSCAVRLMSNEEYQQRRALFESAIDEVNDGSYASRRIHGFLSAPKGSSVARFIPVLTFTDTAVYFACMQHIDRKLAGATVPNTFGGWQLGTARREMEEQEAMRLFSGEGCPSMPSSCYNRAAWMKHWQSFWKLLAARYEGADDEAWFAMFDIANFYDSVDLRRLETSVRAASGDDHFAINVLFHLLGSWNRALCLYTHSTKGLPMDLVGDCSRLLANYFLTTFDKAFREHVQSHNGDFMRFADDMVVCSETRVGCEKFVFEASSRLHELGLNVNVAKVKYCSKREFQRFWGFVIMDRFESGEVKDALSLLREVVDDNAFGRRSTALKRAITIVDREPDVGLWRRWVHDAVIAADLPLQLSREQLLAFLRLSGDFPAALGDTIRAVVGQTFTQPKAILLQVMDGLRTNESREVRDLCSDGIRQIGELGDPVLNLALKNLSNPN
jgi:hypothetical protein